jgi:signal peptidase I
VTLLAQPKVSVILGALCALVAVPLGARMFAFEPFVCPGRSMFPSIQPGDRFIAEPLGVMGAARGDVVVARNPVDANGVVVKRVVAVGGDEVWIHGGRVELGGVPAPRCELGPFSLSPGVLGTAYAESLDGRTFLTLVIDGVGAGDRCVAAPCRIPDGEVFLVGDNRDDSLDSRTWGSVAVGELVGRARWVHYRDDARIPHGDLAGPPAVPSELRGAYETCLGLTASAVEVPTAAW